MGTFNDYLISKGHSTQSVEAERRQLGYFFTWCDQEDMEPEEAGYRDLLAYVAHMRKSGTIKPITMQKYMGTLRHFFTWQIKNGKREDNPARDIDIQDIQRKQLHVILTRQELERIYNDYGNTQPVNTPTRNWEQASALATKRNKAILGLVVFQGLNSHELQALTVKSLELRAGKVHVEGGRRHNGRSLTLEAAQVMDLMEYLPDRQAGTLGVRGELLKLSGKTSDALFVSVGSGSALNNTLNKLLGQITKLEPKVKTLQQLRASVITSWLKTHNLREAQHKAGHRYVSSTEAYLINDLEGLAEDVARFHPIG